MHDLNTLHRARNGGWRVGATTILLIRRHTGQWLIHVPAGNTPAYQSVWDWSLRNNLHDMRFPTRRAAHRAVVACWAADPPAGATAHERVKLRKINAGLLINGRGWRIQRVVPGRWELSMPYGQARPYPTLTAARFELDRLVSLHG